MKHNAVIMFLLSLMLSVQAAAGPARGGITVLEQPDGSTFRARIEGDEFMRIKTDIHGHAVMQDSDGWWCYASYEPDGRKVCSGSRVGVDPPYMILARSLDIPYQRLAELSGKRRREVPSQEVSIFRHMKEDRNLHVKSDGKMVKHGIVILAQFANLNFKHTRSDFERLLTQNGYGRDGGTGCAKEYFEAQFSGMVDFDFDVSNIVTLSHDLAYYGGNEADSDGAESDRAPEEMVIEACRLADAQVDFSRYDDDGDGQVDNVFVFFAGGDEADGSGDDCIWSHAWYIRDGAGKHLELDGKVINRYACTSELSRYYDSAAQSVKVKFAGIGAFCHEYSHTFGFADMYDTDYDASGGRSEALWTSLSLMDGGDKNNLGSTPPYYSAIEREFLGLQEPELIRKSGVYRLEPIHRSGRYYRIDTDTEDEYYLLECRSEEGWDAYIGGHGLLVYHIDKTTRDAGYSDSYQMNIDAYKRWWLYNEVNCRPDHQCADLIEAVRGASNVRNVFYPAGSIDFIDALPYWSGEEGSLSLTGIHMDGDDVVFNVIGGDDDATPPEPKDIVYEKFQDAAIVTFESDRVYEGEATVMWGRTGKEDETMSVLPYEPGKYAVVLDKLKPRTSYTLSVSFSINGVSGKAGTVSFMTSSDNGGYPYIYMKNVKRNPDGSFPKGSRLPLRVYNAVGAKDMLWTFNGGYIAPDASGYYKVRKNGELKVTIWWEEGGKDVLVKKITVSE